MALMNENANPNTNIFPGYSRCGKNAALTLILLSFSFSLLWTKSKICSEANGYQTELNGWDIFALISLFL